MGVHNLKTGCGFLLFIMTAGRILIPLVKHGKFGSLSFNLRVLLFLVSSN